MDVDSMKSSARDQMEMMTMMMQMGKLPQYFAHNYQEIYELPELEFSGVSTSSLEPRPAASHTSFMASPLFEEPMTLFLPPSFPTPKFRNELPMQVTNSTEAMREMIFGMAAMQPIQIDPEAVKPPQRRNVKISKDPQSVAARHRRERISEKIRILQRLVPGGTKMDTASMLDEAVHYMKFLKKQVQSLERTAAGSNRSMGVGHPAMSVNMNYSPLANACQPTAAQMVGSMQTMLT